MLYDHYHNTCVSNNELIRGGALTKGDNSYEVQCFLDYFKKQRDAYRTDTVLVMYGDDFTLTTPQTFEDLQTIIEALQKRINESDSIDGVKYDVKISSMKDYFADVYKQV